MQHLPNTVEEQLVLKSINDECPWENLPKRLQATLASKEEWHRRIINHCIRKRFHWNTSFARKVCKEGEYYEEMMRYLRKNLALFPYHLAEYVCRVMRISPFRYYCDMLFEVMRNEQPYDSIPNFSAADSLRLTGIGRNEFIDIMNKCRSKKIMWKLNKSIAKELLPTQPVDFSIESWWEICLVNYTMEEYRKLTVEETATIEKAGNQETNSFILFDPEIVRGLFRRGLIYFDVPVSPNDRFKVSRLEGFVSNREQSYEDPIEELLYAVFVVSSESATVAEMAATLLADLSQLRAAASFACRLGWAVKVIDPATVLQDSSLVGFPSNMLSDEDDVSHASRSSSICADGNAVALDGTGLENYKGGPARVALVVDANITSYLMMGSLSPGLKSHAVTLYEAGKLGNASIADLCNDLATLEGKKFEGELQEFANHAYSLRCILECLRSGGVTTASEDEVSHDKTELLPSTSDVNSPVASDVSINEITFESEMKELKVSNASSIDLVESTVPEVGDTTDSISKNVVNEYDPTATFGSGIGITEDSKTDHDFSVDGNPKLSDCSHTEKGISKKIKKCSVNILRCESLATLAPATLDRLFRRDYDIVVSMVPLPHSSVLPGPAGPIHFGPPSYSSMTPWMKLVLYSAVGSGPLSVILMKGQCLRLLPAPLAGCEKALLWSWDGSSIGGLGGKFEGNLVNGKILLHCLNSLLKYSALLVLPLSKCDLDESGKIVTLDLPLPLKDSNGSIANVENEIGLSKGEHTKLNSLLSHLSDQIELGTFGYIRLLKLKKERGSDFFSSDVEEYEWVPLSLEFGIPLFCPKLCIKICERVVSSHLLQMDSLTTHHDAMHGLRKRLNEICAEYQATGPTARLLYQREQAKESPYQLMNYASGRWNPLVEPSTPISEASSENQRLKLANRPRCITEVLSFDGNILRSYAVAPVYEAATRPVEESTVPMNEKTEQDDADCREVVLPGVNLIFDGSQLNPFDIGACLQARQPVSLIAEASAASAALQSKSTW